MKHDRFKFIAATVSGNVIEWYDFALYGYFATVFGKLFFPSKDQFFSLLLALGAFSTGFLSRLAGSVLFGYIGDRYGRRASLLVSMFLIIFPTVLIGLLPTYASIGIWAPIGLITCRLFQGLAVSGELTAAGIYLLECGTTIRQGLYGSLVMCSIYIGLLLGAGVCSWITITFNNSEVETFAWRIPFLLSMVLGLVTIYLRYNAKDSPVFTALIDKSKIDSSPITTVCKAFFPNIVFVVMLGSILAVVIYLLIGYFPTYFVATLKLSLHQSMQLSVISLLILSILVPCLGYLSDKLGYYKLYAAGCIAFIVFGNVILELLSSGIFGKMCWGVVILTTLLAPIAATIMPIMINAFPGHIRCSGVSIGYNVSMTIFGGTTPVVALISSHYLSVNNMLVMYIAFTASLALIALGCLQKSFKHSECVLKEQLQP